MGMSWPVMFLAAGETRNRTASPTSDSSTNRPRAVCAAKSASLTTVDPVVAVLMLAERAAEEIRRSG